MGREERRDDWRQADTWQVDVGQGSEEEAGHQGGPEDSCSHMWNEETSPLPPRHCHSERDTALPEEHRDAHPEAVISAPGA